MVDKQGSSTLTAENLAEEAANIHKRLDAIEEQLRRIPGDAFERWTTAMLGHYGEYKKREE